ncbi:MAG TPA: glycine zipper 2TM domain-containing protein [Longimicrobiales bacterium]
MARKRGWTALAVLLPLALAPAACGDGQDERAALEQEELDRELELALQGDTTPATFADTAVSAPADPAPAPAPAPPPRRAAPQRSPRPSRPAPEREREDPAPRPRTETLSVPAGTTFAVRLDETVSTDRNVPGDPFTATLADPIVGPDGTVLIPSGATVRGRVTAVDKSDRVGDMAVIKLAFESISFGGRSYPLQATVVEAHPERRTRTTAKESAAKVAVGAAAGALLGQVLGKNTESTLKGAAVGAAAGTAIAMGTADVDAVLPSGSRMVIRLDAPVEVTRTVM